MHPELSLVLLTVLAGAGQGVFILIVALDALFYNTGIPQGYVLAGVIISMIFQIAGIITSTSHLGNPGRGWRAALMFKHSWLSREVITLSLSVAFAFVYLVLSYYGAYANLRIIAGGLGILANIGFYISSSMVYASVRFIREWSNTFTPINFLLFGVTSGFAVNFAIAHYTSLDVSIINSINRVLLGLGSVSFFMKVLSYRFNANVYVSVNIKNAVGINDPDIKLMDMGTSYDHYNTKEYYHPLSDSGNSNAKKLIIAVTFVLPLIIWAVTLSNFMVQLNALLSILAALSMMTGLVFERRLFFMHGNNLQNMYYGKFRSSGAKNPLLRKAKKGTPTPVI